MAVVLSEIEIQLAELVAENFTEYAWAKPHLAALRKRRGLLAKVFGKKGAKDGVHKRNRKILVYCLPLLFLVLQRDIYAAVKFSSQVVGVGTAVVAHKALGSTIGQLKEIEPAFGHDLPGQLATVCLDLTVDEMARWKAAGLRELSEFCS